MTNAKLPDALRLSGLRNLCNLLKLPVFVGRIRRLRRIRHEQRARCQQSEAGVGLRMMTNAKLPDALRLSGLRNLRNLLKLHVFVGRIRRSRRIRHEQRARCQQSERHDLWR